MILSEIYDPDSINGWKISNFRFMICLWFNISVRYLTILLLVFKDLLLNLYLKLFIVDKNSISWDFNQNTKIRYYQ